MTLTAQEHQKIAVLQTAANLVGQAQRVAGNPGVLRNTIDRLLPQIAQWERSDPEFQELAIQLRRARSGMSPHYLTNIAGQVQRMIALVRTGLPYKVDPQYGLKTQWDPVRGHVTSPLFEEGEPIRTYSHMGWRGSQKFPFGLPFPQKNVIEGWELGETDFLGKMKSAAIGIVGGTLVGWLVDSMWIEQPILREFAGPLAASIVATALYAIF
jgi:hypothetical protein